MEWISRQIAGFGRHPNKRPKGLFVDSEGNMLLEQVMHLWGYQQELEDRDVLLAVQENMFHEDGNLRFAIDNDSEGRLKIRVLPKRDRWHNGGSTPPTWKPAQSSSWGSRITPEKRAPAMRGSVATANMSTAKKIDMPLESLIQTEQAAASIPSPMMADPEAQYGEYLRSAFDHAMNLQRETQRSNVHRAFEQMGLTTATSGIRQKGKGNWNPNGRYARGKNSWKKGNESHNPESPSRHRRVGSRSPSHEGSEDEALAEITRKTLNVASPLAATGITLGHDLGMGLQKKPTPPPGVHWTKYEDEGNLWWYYDGPLGKFWCPDSKKGDIQPFDDEE